ncbi:hypothetical protein AQUCO_05500020v1 [Aquilegia coerulea]|uniref:Uncharacterized protein n=1 Tax=Aquilegia coerulea TaxID=218851 RepID=A0A2G5CGR3_AQUCA|nr:hypothetical protein AQUCO_05500020v1 [Aquilegia coerulea]
MVLMNELLDQSGAKIEQILSSLKHDLPEIKPEHFATRVQEILETFNEMRESLQPLHHICGGLDLESISSQVLLQLLLKNESLGSENEAELVETVSLNNGLELPVQQIMIKAPKFEYQGILLSSQLKHMETIWEWLNNDHVATIGFEGEVGMGKTWMARQLKDRAMAVNLFDIVFWIDSTHTTLAKSQEHIVEQLGLSVTREPNEEYYDIEDLILKVALELGKKRYLLIINDFRYKHAVLNDFGFSEPWQQNVASKVLISGPKKYIELLDSDRVCQVEPLNRDEAWLLFLGTTGLDIDSPYAHEVARPLVDSFDGKPSEIVSRGGDVAGLTYRVCHLLNSGKKEVIECLRSCTWFSAEDRIMVKDLILWWIVEMFLDDCLGLEEACEKAHCILEELIDSRLLERNETHVWVKTLVPHLKFADSFIPWKYYNDRSCVINENFKSKDSDDAREETEFLLIYGKEACLPRKIPDLFFKNMQKLQTLAILDAGIVSLPESLPNLENLEILIIRGCSSLKNLDPIRGLQKLRLFRLLGASSLKEIPDDIFKNMGKLVELDLSNSQLKQLPLSFSNIKRLEYLILRGCSRLESIPSMEDFFRLSMLDLSGASVLTSIPNTVYSVTTLDLSGTLIEILPSPSNLERLVRLFLRGCTKIITMPHPDGYKALEVLDLSGATSFRKFQGQTVSYHSLKKLDLSGTLIGHQGLPFVGFYSISKVVLRNCCHLETMPPLAVDLEVLDLSGSMAFKNFHDVPLPDKLRNLDLSRTRIGKLPGWSMHSVMVQLILTECEYLVELPYLELQRLQVLDLSGSTKFKTFKNGSFDKLQRLKTLNLSETQVSNLPTLSQCSELRQLILRKCLNLEQLPHLITLEKLELLDLSGAISFKQFQDESLGKKEELHELNLTETRVVQIPSLSECHNLCKLILGGCSKLEILPNLEALSRLVVLDLSGAISLINFHYQSTGLKYDYLQVLDLSGTQVSDLSFISGCIDLRQLSLKDCPNILTMPRLDELTRLEKLDISRSKTIELSLPSRSKSLCQLVLSDCSNIQELTSLKEHTRLEVLDLSGTKIEDFSVLSGFNNICKLSLRGCLNLERLSFEGMHNLQKVDLSHNPIKLLPSSISGLRNLRTLLLRDCSSLETLPHMEFLTKLEVFDLSCTTVREFPDGISALTHLRFLLQEENSLWGFHNGKSFERFHFCLFAPKERIRENDIYLQGQQYSFRDIYYQTSHIPPIREEPDRFFKICGFQNFPAGIEEVLVHVELLYLKKNNFLTRLSNMGAENVKVMRECWIENCDSMETVFCGEEVDENAALGRCLQNLWVSKLYELKSLFGGVVQPGSFTLLKHLYIECCPSLITVFSSHLELKNLEVLKIKFCDRIEGIYGETVLGEKTLPKLKTLILLKLPELQSICGGVLPSLKHLRVIGCSKITRLPVSRKTISPVKIKGEAVWWNNLEWEDEGTKSHQRFSPF